MNFEDLYFQITQKVMSIKQSQSIRSLLERKPLFLRVQDTLRYDCLRAMYACDFDMLDPLLARLRKVYGSNTTF